MRGFRLVRLAAAIAAIASAQTARIGVDPRVELFSLIFRLAGNSEYTQGVIPGYNSAVNAWFASWSNHAAVRLARDLRSRDGVGYDAVMSLAIHVTDIDTLAERVSFEQAATLDSRWHGANARQFLSAVRSFVSDTRFRDFLASQQSLYDLANARVREVAEANLDLTWWDRFFGPRPVTASLVPGLLNGGSSYGTRVVDGTGAEEVYAIVGVWLIDAQGQPAFSPGQVSTAVHEFSHSYANPLVDLYGAQLDPAGDRLFQAFRTQMQSMGYASGRTVLYESLVRAATARYAAEKKGPAGGDQSVQYEHGRWFVWTGELSKLLFQYERSRERYPTLEAFMPRVVEFLNEASLAPSSMQTRYEQTRPKVVDVSPPVGAVDVDPRLREIVVRFDRPMLRASTVLPRVAYLYPRVLGADFDDSAQVCRISVALEPNRDYEFSLNTAGEGWFGSAEGVALEPHLIWFHTRAGERPVVPRGSAIPRPDSPRRPR